MNRLHTEDAKRKARETKANNLPQISNQEERESHIHVDHYLGKVYMYTNNATVMNRIDALGLEVVTEDILDGQVYGRSYEVDFDDMNLLLRVTLYKCR